MSATRKSTAAAPHATRRERRAEQRTSQHSQAHTPRQPWWRSPIVMITIGAIVVGVAIVAYALLTQPKTSPDSLTPPAVAVPAGLADGRNLGSAQAPVTIDVWADFQCPACGNLARRVEPPLISQFVSTGMARLVYHDAAFQGQKAASAWDESVEPAAAARCASDQGLFWQMHDWLFANQTGENVGSFAQDRLRAIAQAAGLDMAAYDTCMASPTYAGLVRKETTEGASKGVDQTPTLYINGTYYTGAMSVTSIGDAIVAAAGGASPAPMGSQQPVSSAAAGASAAPTSVP